MKSRIVLPPPGHLVPRGHSSAGHDVPVNLDLYRVHQSVYRGNSMNPVNQPPSSEVKGGRFDGLRLPANHFLHSPKAVAYYSGDCIAALHEAIIGRRWYSSRSKGRVPSSRLPASAFDRYSVSRVRVRRSLNYFDLDDLRECNSCGVPPTLATEPNYSITRHWAAWLHRNVRSDAFRYRGALGHAFCFVLFRNLTKAEASRNRIDAAFLLGRGSTTRGVRVMETLDLSSDEGQEQVELWLVATGLSLYPS